MAIDKTLVLAWYVGDRPNRTVASVSGHIYPVLGKYNYGRLSGPKNKKKPTTYLTVLKVDCDKSPFFEQVTVSSVKGVKGFTKARLESFVKKGLILDDTVKKEN